MRECGGGAWRGGGKADDPVIPLFLLVLLHTDRKVQGVGGGAEQEQLGGHSSCWELGRLEVSLSSCF